MNDHQLRDAYEAALQNGHVVRPVDLPLDRLEALIDGSGTEEERLRSLDVLLSTVQGRQEFEVAWAAARAARGTTRSVRGFFTPWRVSALATAAVLLVAVTALLINKREPESELMRGEDSPVQLVSPSNGDVAPRDVRFTWRRVAEAREYMLVVVDTAGGDVFASNTDDTTVVLPDSVALTPGGEYLWWVQATMSDGTTISAITKRFRVKKTP